MIRRRAIASLVALAAQAASLRAGAQLSRSGDVRVIGHLSLESAPTPYPTPEQWRQRSAAVLLRQFGWDEGRNLVIERAYAGLDSERLDALAGSLIAKGVEVIVASGPEAALAAARATRKVPIVCFNLVWPEEQGLIDSFGRPGRNVTGVSFYPGIEASAKRMEILRELAPAAKRLSWLWPSDYEQTLSRATFHMTPVFEPIANALGFELRFHRIRSMKDINVAFQDMLGGRTHALMASGEHVVHARQHIAAFALRHRMPSACPSLEMVEAGGLFSYGVGRADLLRLFRRSFEYVDRILRGTRPGDLPVERPKTYELAINRRTAAAIGIKVPQAVIVRADSVVD